MATRRQDRPRWWRDEDVLAPALGVGVPLVLLYGLFVWSMLDNPLSSSVDEHVVFGEVDGDEVVVVTYERQGDRSPLALPHWIQSGYDRRATAVATATGEPLWDVSVDYWWPQGGTAPLAVGGGRVYVVVAGGLVILDAADGARLAGPDEIEGLGSPVLEAQGAYGYDVESDQVVALTADGDVVGIPVGADAAVPVDADVLERWSDRLSIAQDNPYPNDSGPGVLVESHSRPVEDDPCEDASGTCVVSPSGVVVEVRSALPIGDDYLDVLVVAGVRTELGTQGLRG